MLKIAKQVAKKFFRKTYHAKVIRTSEFFDEAWYKKTYKIPKFQNASKHYLNEGFKLGYNPSRFFSTSEYLKANEDVAASGINPLLHYELSGKYEFRFFDCVKDV